MDNNKEQKNYGWDYFEGIYENVLKKQVTFSEEMGEKIKKEIEKMYKQRDEWLKNQENIKREENDTGTISKGS